MDDGDFLELGHDGVVEETLGRGDGLHRVHAAQVDLLIVPADGDAVKLDRRGRRGRARRRCGRSRLIYYDGGGGRFVRAARAKNTKRGCGKE